MNGFIQRNEKSVQNEYSHSTETKKFRDRKRSEKKTERLATSGLQTEPEP